MSGEQTDHTAPTLAHARNATIVCGTFGRIATTRSPGTTPSARSDAASDATLRSSSRHETSPSAPDSSPATIAHRASVAWRNAWSATFCRAPGNHSAPGIERRPSTRSYGTEARMSKKCQTALQKPSRSVTDQRHSDS